MPWRCCIFERPKIIITFLITSCIVNIFMLPNFFQNSSIFWGKCKKLLRRHIWPFFLEKETFVLGIRQGRGVYLHYNVPWHRFHCCVTRYQQWIAKQGKVCRSYVATSQVCFQDLPRDFSYHILEFGTVCAFCEVLPASNFFLNLWSVEIDTCLSNVKEEESDLFYALQVKVRMLEIS